MGPRGDCWNKKQKKHKLPPNNSNSKKDKPVFQSLSMIVTASRAPEGCAEGAEFSGLGFQSFVFQLGQLLCGSGMRFVFGRIIGTGFGLEIIFPTHNSINPL